MLSDGQSSTWPKLLFIENRLKIERLIERGLIKGDSNEGSIGNATGDDPELASRYDNPTCTARPSSALSITEKHHSWSRKKHSSLLEELRRQSAVFFDDKVGDGDEIGESDEDIAAVRD